MKPVSTQAGATQARGSAGAVDMHVHVVGNGSGNSGCWLRVRGARRLLASIMVRHIGLPANALTLDLERLYLERVLEMIRTSSLSAAVILAQDLPHDNSGRPTPELGAFFVPNDYVLGLARNHPRLLPAISIHPGRPDAVEELNRCIAGGAVMMKCLPNCQNINCSDRRFTLFWERMAEAGLPLLAHTGGEHTLPVLRPEYADPRILKLPLECGVTVIAAHCGTRSGVFDPDYFRVFAEMTRQYPSLYGDTSAFNVPFRGKHIPECLKPPLCERLVHGSDFPVPVHGHWAWLRGFLRWADFRKWERNPNILERDYQLKLAMGFPAECFSRIRDLMPRAPRKQPLPIQP